jgi:fucose 4-O-acetylase-like acetyltransferase
MRQPPAPPTEQPRDYRLDILKALCISLVLIWHLETIDISTRIQAYHVNIILKEAIKAFYFQVTLLAVPTFFIVSLYLLYRKLEGSGQGYFVKRLSHLIALFLFWVACQYAIYYLAVIPKSVSPSEQISQFLDSIHTGTIIFSGGPALPFVGASVFYFLSVLIFITVFAAIFHLIARIRWLGITIGAISITAFLIYFETGALRGIEISSGGFQSFAIYIPISYLLHISRNRSSKAALALLLTGYILFSIQDYQLRIQEVPFNVYARPSIVFGATALFYGIKNLKTTTESKAVTALSNFSLGIFATHKYFQYLSIIALTPYLESAGLTKKIPFGELRVNVQTIVITISTLLLTFGCLFLMSKTPLRKFIK